MNAPETDKVTCKYCRSIKTRKYGIVEGIQRYFCNDCKRKFSPNRQTFRMKTPVDQVAFAMDQYYQGMSINIVRNQLETRYGNYPSSKTVYGWITKYTLEAIRQFKDYYLEVGDIWTAYEAVVSLDSTDYRCIDIIDMKTGYLLVTKLLPMHGKPDISDPLEKASARAGKSPKKFLRYNHKDDSRSGKSDLSEDNAGNPSWIEACQKPLNDRTHILHRLKSVAAANRFTEGFRVYYNYLCPNKITAGKTAAEMANVVYLTKSWLDIILTNDPDTHVTTDPETSG